MRRIRALGAFLYDFIVGDDPAVAIAVVAALALTALVAAAGVSAWWVLPVAITSILALSLRRAATNDGRKR